MKLIKTYITANIKILIASIVAVFMPITPLILTILSLVMVDFILAIYRVWKIDPSQITSRKMSNTISKILIYTLCIMALYLMENYILGPILPITKIASGLICFVELKSIDETFKAMLGYSLWNLISKVAQRGESNTKDIIETIEKET